MHDDVDCRESHFRKVVEALEKELVEERRLSKEFIGRPCFHSITVKDCDFCALRNQLAAAKAEILRLSGKTDYCALCESYAKSSIRLREALEKISKIPVESTDFHEYVMLKTVNRIAFSALNNEQQNHCGAHEGPCGSHDGRAALDGGKP